MRVRIETRTGTIGRVDPLQPDPPVVLELAAGERLIGFESRRSAIEPGKDTITLRWTATVEVAL